MQEADLLGVLLHELLGPVSTAVLDLDSQRRSMRRLIRQLRMLQVMRACLLDDPTQLPSLRRRTLAKAVLAAEMASGSVRAQLPQDLAVRCAEGALDAVLQNLFQNAHRHARGSLVTVRARKLRPDERPWPDGSPVTIKAIPVLIEVADQGPGVPDDLRPTLFQFGAKTKSNRAGFGIGLWLARILVRAHGGELWLERSLAGAVFASVWPMASEKKRRIAQRTAATPHSHGARADGWPAGTRDFGVAIRGAREQALLIREELAAQAGISDSTLRNIETGRHRCTLKNRAKLVSALAQLGIAPDSLPPEP